jgi:hypothetical protein
MKQEAITSIRANKHTTPKQGHSLFERGVFILIF